MKKNIKKSNSCFVGPKWPNARANKIGINFIFLLKYLSKIVCNAIRNNIFQYNPKPFLIQRILIGFEAILEIPFPVQLAQDQQDKQEIFI